MSRPATAGSGPEANGVPVSSWAPPWEALAVSSIGLTQEKVAEMTNAAVMVSRKVKASPRRA